MMLTPEDAAATWLCPLARTFATIPAQAMCRGKDCASWRWEKISASNPKFVAAVRAVAAETGEKAPFAKAAATVAADLDAHGLSVKRGFCGVGGLP